LIRLPVGIVNPDWDLRRLEEMLVGGWLVSNARTMDQSRYWVQCRLVRGFAAAAETSTIQRGHPIVPGNPFADWVKWATAYADQSGPLVAGEKESEGIPEGGH